MKRKRAAAVALAVVLLAAAGAWQWSGKRSRRGRGRGESRAVEVTRGPIEQTVDATGSVSPLNRVEIKPPIGGRVEKLLVDEGDKVAAGQIVAWMSSSDRAAILDAARAQGPEHLKRWEDSYKPTPVVASLPGEVILRNVVVGQAVDANTVLFAVADALIVNAQVDEADIGRVREGQEARIRLDAYPDRVVDGKVFDILYEGKNVSNVITYGVRVRPDKVPPFFRSQMTANVSFVIGRKEDALLVPSGALRDQPGGKRAVRVPVPDSPPETREVKVGIETDENVEILEGLAEGDKVLVSGGGYVAEKAPETSPLSFMRGRDQGRSSGAAPRPRQRPAGGGQ